MSIGERITLARKNACMTQQELAEAVGVSKSTIAGYELSTREPDATKIRRIAIALNVSGDFILDMAAPPSQDYIPTPEGLKVAKDFDNLNAEGMYLVKGHLALVVDIYRKS